MSGRLPLKKRLSSEDVERLIMKGDWMSINEKAPCLKRYVELEDSSRNICVLLQVSGGMNITGLKKIVEGGRVYDLVFKEIHKLLPKIL